MTEILIILWAVGAAGVLLLALTHPGSWPYTKGGYHQNRWQMRRRFWGRIAAFAALWPVGVVVAGLMATWEELT